MKCAKNKLITFSSVIQRQGERRERKLTTDCNKTECEYRVDPLLYYSQICWEKMCKNKGKRINNKYRKYTKCGSKAEGKIKNIKRNRLSIAE